MSCVINVNETKFGYHTSKKIWFDHFDAPDSIEVDGEWDLTCYDEVYVGCTCTQCDKQEHHTVEFRNYDIDDSYHVRYTLCYECFDKPDSDLSLSDSESDLIDDDWTTSLQSLFQIPGVEYHGPGF